MFLFLDKKWVGFDNEINQIVVIPMMLPYRRSTAKYTLLSKKQRKKINDFKLKNIYTFLLKDCDYNFEVKNQILKVATNETNTLH